MAVTKMQFSIAALILGGAALGLLVQHQAQTRLRQETQALRQQVARLQSENDSLSSRLRKSAPAPRLPAPHVAATSTSAPGEELRSTNLYARLKDYQGKLSLQQVEPYLAANHRNAASLLAAYRSTGDLSLLEEAMQRFPNDPQVAFEAGFRANALPEERRQWLEALEKSAPQNALPNYLMALDYFKSGQTDQAVQELMAANGKRQFEDYTLDRMQNDEEAYLAAGYPVADAKTIPSQQLLLPQLKQLKDLSGYMVTLANSYRTLGDTSSAQAALEMAANLGQRYSSGGAGEVEISQLVGMAVERIALGQMDLSSPYGPNGQTVQDRMNELSQHRNELQMLNQQFEPLQAIMTDQDWISYKDRWRMFGEEAALRWVIGKYGQK